MLYRAAKSTALPANPVGSLQRCKLLPPVQGFMTAERAAQTVTQAAHAAASPACLPPRQTVASRPAKQGEPRPGSLRSFRAMEQLMEQAWRPRELPSSEAAGAADQGQAVCADTGHGGLRVKGHFRARKLQARAVLQPLSTNTHSVPELSKTAGMHSPKLRADAAQHTTSRSRAACRSTNPKRAAGWRGSAAATWPCFALQDFAVMDTLVRNITKV